MYVMVAARSALPSGVGTVAGWGRVVVLAMIICGSRLLGCDDGRTVPDPDQNTGLVADCKILLGLRDTLVGSGSLNWAAGLAIDDWEGVTISGTPSRIWELELDYHNLTGEIPVELGQLEQLRRLNLSHNELTGKIPTGLVRLRRLEYLSLEYNELTGEIPAELTRLRLLRRLHLNNNELTGEISPNLSQLILLQHLWLDINRLRGEIPAELGRLSQLQSLYLNDNELTGEIPVELSRLKRLRHLGLDDNRLTGPIPVELAQISRLQSLFLHNNQLTGEIPVELAELTRLESLALSWNQLTGMIPVELSQLSQVSWLGLGDNRLTGPIPAELAQLSQLFVLRLGGNQLRGRIPFELGQLIHLHELHLGENQLRGQIPATLGQLTGLRYLYLDHNELTGPIPPELGQLSQLYELRVNHNELSGGIPPALGQLDQLRNLRLDHNQLTGPIPIAMGRLTQVRRLRLDHNQLTGPIPAALAQMNELSRLRLDGNRLTGPIPAELGQMPSLFALHLQNNRLTGPIPAELSQLPFLREFSFRGNRLTGSVPGKLSRLPDVYLLNLTATLVAPGRIKITWDDPGDPNVSYSYRLWGSNSRVLVDSTQIPKGNLRVRGEVTIEWMLTGLPTDLVYEKIELRAINGSGFSPTNYATVRMTSPPGDLDGGLLHDAYCLSLWDRESCATVAVIPHVFMGPLGENDAHAEIVLTRLDSKDQICDVALLYHRGSAAAPGILFNDRFVERNLLRTTVPMKGAQILTLTVDSAELTAGALSVFVRSPCAAESLQIQGRYLVENRMDGQIREVLSVSGQSPQQWLGDGDCQVLMGAFGDGSDLGFVSVSADPERIAPFGTRLHFRAFDLDGNPIGNRTGMEITGEHNAAFPWNFQEPTTIEMCLDVPEMDSDYKISTTAIGILRQGENIQWNDEPYVDAYTPAYPSAWSDRDP